MHTYVEWFLCYDFKPLLKSESYEIASNFTNEIFVSGVFNHSQEFASVKIQPARKLRLAPNLMMIKSLWINS